METFAIIFGTYVISLALTESDGPFGLLHKLRNQKWMKDFGLLECYLCTAAWVAIILGLAFSQPLMIFIAWGAAVLAYKIVNLTLLLAQK